MKNLRKLLTCLFFVFTLHITLYTLHSEAAIPHLINYQGRLTDKDNKPLEGAYALTFRIYDAETAGSLLWEETHSGVVIQKGIFGVLLGSVTNLNIPFDKPYFLEIKVGSEVMSPRQRITSAGYAMRAEEADSLPRGVITMWSGTIANIPLGWALCDGTNGTPDLRDRFIVGANQDSGGKAKTNVNGSLTLLGGEAAHTLTINEIPSHTHTTAGQRFIAGSQGPAATNANPDLPVTSDSTGGGAAHNNLPPYYALVFIMKL